MEMALGCEQGGFEALAQRVAALVKPEPPTGLIDKLKKIPELAKIASFPPKVVRSGTCQQVIKTGQEIDLFQLPIIKCWPDDGDPRKFDYPVDMPGPGDGRYITFGAIHTVHPETGDRNVGMYRMQLLDRNHTAMHWHVHHDGGEALAGMEKTG